MKIKVILIIGLILLVNISIAGASTLIPLNKNQVIEKGKDGRIYGYVETQGRCVVIGIPNLLVLCGTNPFNRKLDITNEYGFFEFTNLTYKDTGTKYFIWILPFQKVIFPVLKTVELDAENPEDHVYFFIILW